MIMLVYACFLVFHDVSWFLESFQRSFLWVIGRCNKILSMQNLKLEKWMLSTTDFQDACHCKEQNKRKCMNMTCQILNWNISGELKVEVWSCQVSLSCLQFSFQHAWEDFISKLRVAQQLQQIWKTKKQTMRWCHCRETTKSCWTRNWWQSNSWVSLISKFYPCSEMFLLFEVWCHVFCQIRSLRVMLNYTSRQVMNLWSFQKQTLNICPGIVLHCSDTFTNKHEPI